MNTVNIEIGKLTYCRPMKFFDIVKMMLKRYEVRTRELSTKEYIQILEGRNERERSKQNIRRTENLL